MRGERGALDALHHRVRPAANEPEGALVLFHGRGADEHDLFPLLDILDPDLRLLGVTPRGPLMPAPAPAKPTPPPRALASTPAEPPPPLSGPAPSSLRRPGGSVEPTPLLPPGGAHWYIVRELGYPDPDTFLPTYAEAAVWLDALAESSGIPPERTVLGGFSQGAVMAYALGLGAGRPRPAAIIALSGFLPTVPGFALDLAPPLPPVAIGHGTFDPIIGVEWGRRARATLEQAGADVLDREYPLPHAIDPRFLDELVPWVRRAIEA
jgi:phospholipase/carboxylesterase